MSNLPPAGTEHMPLGQPIAPAPVPASEPATATAPAGPPPPQLETAEPEDPSRLVPVGIIVPVPASGVGEGGPPLPPKPAPIPVPAPAPAPAPAPIDTAPGPGTGPAGAPAPVEHPVPEPQHGIPDTTHPSTDSHPVDPTAPKSAPTATIDPNIPSSESAPTALPTNPNTHPGQQKEAIKNEHPEVVKREVEKTKAAERDLKGEEALGTVVRGIEDDRLYAMLRRFDTHVKHVLHPATHTPAKEPDLRPSSLPNLPSHSETLKINLERAIAAIGPSTMLGMREMGRLMDWSPRERRRTAMFCISYFTCWIFGYALLGVMSFGVAIVCFPSCRRWFFPPVPPAPFTPPSATDPTNQKGDESLLGNVDKATVHRSKAEQAEEQAFEAASVLQAFTTRLIFDGKKHSKNAGNSAVGEKRHTDEEDQSSSSSSSSSDDDEKTIVKVRPEQAGHSQGQGDADVVVAGEEIHIDEKVSEKERKKLAAREAKKKRDQLVSKMVKGAESGLGAFADMTEMFTNALSPPSCYPDSHSRFKIAGAFIVVPFFALHVVPAWMVARGATFAFGVGMWGQPLLKGAAKKAMVYLPENWPELVDIRNSILSRVPTDAQLTIHLLRVAEALETPLPRAPPPPLKGTPKEAIKDSSPADINEEDEAEVEEAEEEGGLKEAAVKVKHKTKSSILGMFRHGGKKAAGARGDVSVDGKGKRIGTKIDKVLFRGNVQDDGQINSFPARLDRTSGHLILEGRSHNLLEPQISFVPISATKATFTYPIDDIVEIKKSHVTMARLALGWLSSSDVEGLGMTLRFKSMDQQFKEMNGGETIEGETLHFTRIGRREHLFVRLVSMGRQRWEML